MLAALPDDLRGLRDRALPLIGFAGGLRRSELVGLDIGDVVEEPEGLRVTIRRSKTDQEGAGRVIGTKRGVTPRRTLWPPWRGGEEAGGGKPCMCPTAVAQRRLAASAATSALDRIVPAERARGHRLMTRTPLSRDDMPERG